MHVGGITEGINFNGNEEQECYGSEGVQVCGPLGGAGWVAVCGET
jgi:hypothetical protein